MDRIEKLHEIIEEHCHMPGALIPILQNINTTLGNTDRGIDRYFGCLFCQGEKTRKRYNQTVQLDNSDLFPKMVFIEVT